jgi:hypothetical protein
MRSPRIDFIALAAVLVLGGPTAAAFAADEPKAEPAKVEQAKQDNESRARQAGREVKEGAREAGHAVKETAREAGHAVKGAVNEAKPPVKSAWQEVKHAATDFGRSVKGFFKGLFRD